MAMECDEQLDILIGHFLKAKSYGFLTKKEKIEFARALSFFGYGITIKGEIIKIGGEKAKMG